MRTLRIAMLTFYWFTIVSFVLAQRPRPVDHLLSGALGGAMLADEITSYQYPKRCPACRELGLQASARIPIKASLFTFVLVAERRWPEHRTAFRVFKLGMIGLYGWAAWHNNGLGR